MGDGQRARPVRIEARKGDTGLWEITDGERRLAADVQEMTPHAPQQAIALTSEPMAIDRDFVYRIEILEDPSLVAVTTSGDATVSGWARLHDGLRADPRVQGLPLLIDHTALDATFLTIGDVRLIGESVAAFGQGPASTSARGCRRRWL